MLKNISLLNSSRNYYPKYSTIKKLQPHVRKENQETVFKNKVAKIKQKQNDVIFVERKKSSRKKRKSPKKRSPKKRSPKIEIDLGKDMIQERQNSKKRTQKSVGFKSRPAQVVSKPRSQKSRPAQVVSKPRSQKFRPAQVVTKPRPQKVLKKIPGKPKKIFEPKEDLVVKIRTNPEIFNKFIYKKSFDVNSAKILLKNYGLIKNENVPDELVAYLYQICKDRNVKMKLYIP